MAKIFYFSGTGNSYRVARGLSDRLDNCELVRIDINEAIIDIDEDVVGVVFPLYYFGMPRIVESFFKNYRFKKDCYLFVIVTRGVPFAGGARRQLLDNLTNKISYLQYMTMGDNFNIDFWDSSSVRVRESRNKKADMAIEKIASLITNRKVKRGFVLVDYLWFITKYIPRYGYNAYLEKMYNSDNFFNIDSSSCIKCSKCVRSCPVNNVIIEDEVKWMHQNCQLCLACYHCCPVNAIQYNNGRFNTIGKGQYWNY